MQPLLLCDAIVSMSIHERQISRPLTFSFAFTDTRLYNASVATEHLTLLFYSFFATRFLFHYLQWPINLALGEDTIWRRNMVCGLPATLCRDRCLGIASISSEIIWRSNNGSISISISISKYMFSTVSKSV
jgi:hypothetical protein